MKLREAGEGLEDRDVPIMLLRKVDDNGRIYVGKRYAGEEGLLLLVKLKKGDKIHVEM
jgi:hypothetical protein